MFTHTQSEQVGRFTLPVGVQRQMGLYMEGDPDQAFHTLILPRSYISLHDKEDDVDLGQV